MLATIFGLAPAFAVAQAQTPAQTLFLFAAQPVSLNPDGSLKQEGIDVLSRSPRPRFQRNAKSFADWNRCSGFRRKGVRPATNGAKCTAQFRMTLLGKGLLDRAWALVCLRRSQLALQLLYLSPQGLDLLLLGIELLLTSGVLGVIGFRIVNILVQTELLLQ